MINWYDMVCDTICIITSIPNNNYICGNSINTAQYLLQANCDTFILLNGMFVMRSSSTPETQSVARFAAFSTRLFSVLRYESVIHEFDPYFNYRTTKYLVEEGFYAFHNWFDDMAWYPLGRIIGGTIYPGNIGDVVSL